MTRRTVADEPIGVEENLLMFSTFIIPNHAPATTYIGS